MKSIYWGIALCVLMMTPQKVIANQDFNERLIKQPYSIEGQFSGVQLFNKAYLAYTNAKVAVTKDEQSKYYAEAISDISNAIELEKSNTDYLLLASQIYRGKGGISYAKGYFARAEELLQKKLENNPDDIFSNLDYAVACYAGDARYWTNYADYQEKASFAAFKVLVTCHEKKSENLVLSREEIRAEALANLILGKAEKCYELLKVNDDFYKSLYDSTVIKGQWLWDVSEKAVVKEFLLFYLNDVAESY